MAIPAENLPSCIVPTSITSDLFLLDPLVLPLAPSSETAFMSSTESCEHGTGTIISSSMARGRTAQHPIGRHDKGSYNVRSSARWVHARWLHPVSAIKRSLLTEPKLHGAGIDLVVLDNA